MTYPIVLAHGVCRFDVLWNQFLRADDSDDPRIDKLHYFKGIRTMLQARGYRAYHSRVAWAAELKRSILSLTVWVAWTRAICSSMTATEERFIYASLP